MSKPRSKSSRTKASAKAPPRNLAKELRLVVAVALLVGLIAAGLLLWEQLFPIPPEQLVKIYRTHGCGCAFNLADSLEAQGFVVRLYEYETLQHVRRSLHTPSTMHGCHVGEYLDYFLEGHVAPAALTKLAQQHPAALGVVTETTVDRKHGHVTIAQEETSPVLLVEGDGRTRTWIEPDIPIG